MIKFGPGGIRTHDQRIMSPLRYRCATGPWRIIQNLSSGAALAGKLRFLRYLPLKKCSTVRIFFGRVPQAREKYKIYSIVMDLLILTIKYQKIKRVYFNNPFSRSSAQNLSSPQFISFFLLQFYCNCFVNLVVIK